MKILYVHFYATKFNLGGADRGVFDLARSMQEDHHEKVHCLINAGLLADKLKCAKIDYTLLPAQKWHVFSTLRLMKKVIDEFKPDVIHSHHRYATFLLDSFFKEKAFLLHTQRVTQRDKIFLFRYGHYATAVSEGVRRNLIENFKVPPELVRTIPNAVWLRPLESDRLEAVKNKYPKIPGTVLALCNARLDEQKGHAYLVDAVCLLPAELKKNICILLAGDGPLRGDLEKRIRDKGIEKNFVFLGHSEEIPELLTWCDFSVLPSLWEGLPRTVIESFLMGRPVIATDIPGVQEVLRDGQNGLRVPARNAEALAQALQRCIQSPEEMRRMKAAALEDAARFSFLEMTSAYQALYREKTCS